MKTGNKILLALLCVVALFMLLGAIDWRFRCENKSNLEQRYQFSKSIDKKLPGFKHIVIHKQPWISVVQSEKSMIKVSYNEKRSIPVINFHLVGDTLFVEPSTNESDLFRVEIFYNGNLNSIKVYGARIDLAVKTGKNLSLVLDNAQVFDNNDYNRYGINRLVISAVNGSRVNFDNTSVNDINIQSDNSNFNFNSNVKKLSGSINNTTQVYCKGVEEINLKRGQGCSVNLFN